MNNEFVRIPPRSPWQRPSYWVLAGVLAGLSCCIWTLLDIPGFLTGRTDILGNYVDEVALEERSENLSPRERLHAELFPDWAIAEANRWEVAEERWEMLHGSLEDPTLKQIATELRQLVRAEDLSERGKELEPLLERWNARHEELGERFYVTGSVVMLANGPAVIFEFYAIAARVDVRAGEETFPTLVLQRIDRTNIQESYFGRTSPQSKRAIVVIDRIVDFAIDHIWLQLAYDFEGAPPPNAVAPDIAFHSAMLDELDDVGTAHVATLRETAAIRRELIETMREAQKRQECGSTLRFSPFVPWDGLRPRTLDRLDAYAEADKIQPCPRVKFEEADKLRETSEKLRSHADLEPALGHLVAWLARGTVLHEARHLADDRRHDGLNTPLECEGCPEGLDLRQRAELSAYATSLASAENPATTLYQDCVAAGGSRSHRVALSVLLESMDAFCDEAPPADLADRAQTAEQHFFGRNETVEVLKYPERFPIVWW